MAAIHLPNTSVVPIFPLTHILPFLPRHPHVGILQAFGKRMAAMFLHQPSVMPLFPHNHILPFLPRHPHLGITLGTCKNMAAILRHNRSVEGTPLAILLYDFFFLRSTISAITHMMKLKNVNTKSAIASGLNMKESPVEAIEPAVASSLLLLLLPLLMLLALLL